LSKDHDCQIEEPNQQTMLISLSNGEKTQMDDKLWTEMIGHNPTHSFAIMLTFAMIESNESD